MKKIEFKSQDGLTMTADYYPVKDSKGMLLLCHRSHCNRAEYRETAPKFNELGYSCLAIDQRSGMKVFGEENETKNRAKAKGLPTGYLDATPDLLAGIEKAVAFNKDKPIILLGSSYTAALALRIATHSKQVKALIVFSPDEHLKGVDLQDEIMNLELPIFATSTLKEVNGVSTLFKKMSPRNLTHFIPEKEGFHGSKILWESVKGWEKVWESMKVFLGALG